jgi:integration host factor subunit alpha
MTKADLINEIIEKIGFSKKESTHIVDLIFEIMKNKLEAGEKVKISGLGIFNVKEKAVRRGRNPHTGEPMEISARKVLTFKVGPALNKALNR